MTVVVGVSPSTGSPAALRWGAAEAQLRGVALRAVLAWRPPRSPGSTGTRPPLVLGTAGESPAAEAQTRLHEHVTQALGPDAAVECAAVPGSAVHALLAAAENADLLVIGEPRPGRLASVKASLVAPQVVLKAPCPVVVMPPES
jgi:nucleotide-binding universal stress UspA family protein